MRDLFAAGAGGVAFFTSAPTNPFEVVNTLPDGRPPIAPSGKALLVHGAGRTGYGFARMAARAPGNERSLIMLLPSDIQEWHRLCTTNGNDRYLAGGVIINPKREKRIHILPPRDVRNKVERLAGMVQANRALEPVLVWARKQLEDDRVERAAEYWLKAAQVQAITTRVIDMPSAVNGSFIGGLHPDVQYTLLHPSKSMAAPRRGGEKPLFGHELLQALLTEGGRGDLAGWVVASGGYWVDSSVWRKDRIRIRFVSSESEAAVQSAMHAVGGTTGSYDLVSISGAVGAAAVFEVQFGGWIKNFLANILGEKAARKAAVVGNGVARPDYRVLQSGYLELRQSLIGEAEQLAARVMQKEGLIGASEAVSFPDEVIEDIMACTTLNWPALIHEASALRLFALSRRPGTGPLPEMEIDSIRRGMINFVDTAPEGHFGTTNMTVALVYGLAMMFADAGFVRSFTELFDRQRIVVPEGIRAMPYVAERFGEAGLPEDFTKAIERFQLLFEAR